MFSPLTQEKKLTFFFLKLTFFNVCYQSLFCLFVCLKKKETLKIKLKADVTTVSYHEVGIFPFQFIFEYVCVYIWKYIHKFYMNNMWYSFE